MSFFDHTGSEMLSGSLLPRSPAIGTSAVARRQVPVDCRFQVAGFARSPHGCPRDDGTRG